MNNEFSPLPIDQLPLPNYVGFTKWVQVPPQPKKPKPQHPKNPNPNQCPPPQRREFGVCVNPTNPIIPNPNPTNPNPSPSPTASQPGPFGGTETTAAALLGEGPNPRVSRPPSTV